MSNKKRRRLFSRQKFSRMLRPVRPLLIGFLLTLLGIMLGWEDSSTLDVPEWAVMGPVIEITAEVHGSNLSVSCYMEADGIFTLKLLGGQHLEKAAHVWVVVKDFYSPFRWEIVDGDVNCCVLFPQNTGGDAKADDYTDYRKYVSMALDLTSGEGADLSGRGIHSASFGAVIKPGEEGGCILRFHMKEQTEYQSKGNITVRMPLITNDRSSNVYQMTSGDFKELFDSGEYDLLPQFSNFMIDGIPMFETRPVITGDYFSYYVSDPNIVINRMQPEPYQVLPSISWQEHTQWAPFLSFHDLSYDRCQFFRAWLSGLLIALGGGLAVIPLSNWISSGGKREDECKTAK